MKLLIINGPNLNLLGTREPKIYGSRTFESYLVELREMLDGDEIEYLQSNHEGDIIVFCIIPMPTGLSSTPVPIPTRRSPSPMR